MILCDGNYGLGAYGVDSMHTREPERSRVASHVKAINIMPHRLFLLTWDLAVASTNVVQSA